MWEAVECEHRPASRQGPAQLECLPSCPIPRPAGVLRPAAGFQAPPPHMGGPDGHAVTFPGTNLGRTLAVALVLTALMVLQSKVCATAYHLDVGSWPSLACHAQGPLLPAAANSRTTPCRRPKRLGSTCQPPPVAVSVRLLRPSSHPGRCRQAPRDVMPPAANG